MRTLRPAALAALALSCAALLAACGSGTTTVTAASAPPDTASTAATQTETASTASTATSTPAPTTATTPAPTTTARTAPEPAFTEPETHAQGLAGAIATVRSLGYTPQNSSGYHSGQTLRVLIGTHNGSTSGYGQLAFFFVGNHYIGTDVRVPSAKISVVSQGEAEVTIAYPLYRHGDPLCCPGAGQQNVRFQLNNGKLQALDPIPPAVSATGTSRN
jgi:hypothetical protein